MKRILRGYPLRRRFNLLLHRWHRRIGIAASLFLIWMAISGWLLNHTDRLHLAQHELTSDFIAAHYGIRSAIPARAFIAGEHWLAAGDDAAVLDGKKIAMFFLQPRGMVIKNNLLFIADGSQLILFDVNGELVDKIAAPFTIERIGLGCDGVVVSERQRQLVTVDGVSFANCESSVQWSRNEPLTNLQQTQAASLLHTGVSTERVLLDLHSGRFFGSLGPLFVDALGMGLVVLALSGIWLFVRHRKRH